MSTSSYLTAPYAAYSPRLQTDKLFQPAPGSFTLRPGSLERTILFVQEHQLLDAELWTRFVKQFTFPADDHDLGWRCEYWGKLMRGGALVYSCTRSQELYGQLESTVLDMLSTAGRDGRISTYSPKAQFQGWDIWGRKYVLLGLEYFYDICVNEPLKIKILASLKAQADYLLDHFGPGKLDLRNASCHWEGLNSSSLLEPIVRLYNMTGQREYLNFAGWIVSLGGIQSKNIFELAYEDKLNPYEYPVTKAYEMMSCFEGLLEYARASGETKWAQAAVNFAKRVLASDITIIGSAGCTHELFDHSSLRQADPDFTGIMQETCVTVTWMKLCSQMLCYTGDPAFGDAIERSLYNALSGAVNVNQISQDPLSPHGWLPFDSYSPLRAGKRGQAVGGRMVMEDGTIYGCCAAIAAAGLGLAPSIIALHSRDGIAVNLYIPGEASLQTPQGKALKVYIKTDYPVDEEIRIQLGMPEAEEFSLALRIPSWCCAPYPTVNGEYTIAVPGQWLALKRLWRNGDEIVLRLPMDLRTEDSWKLGNGSETLPPQQAIVRGPVVLARDESLGGPPLSAPLTFWIKSDGALDALSVPLQKLPFQAQQAYDVALQDGGTVRVVDYASAGQDYNSEFAAWLPVKGHGPQTQPERYLRAGHPGAVPAGL